MFLLTACCSSSISVVLCSQGQVYGFESSTLQLPNVNNMHVCKGNECAFKKYLTTSLINQQHANQCCGLQGSYKHKFWYQRTAWYAGTNGTYYHKPSWQLYKATSATKTSLRTSAVRLTKVLAWAWLDERARVIQSAILTTLVNAKPARHFRSRQLLKRWSNTVTANNVELVC